MRKVAEGRIASLIPRRVVKDSLRISGPDRREEPSPVRPRHPAYQPIRPPFITLGNRLLGEGIVRMPRMPLAGLSRSSPAFTPSSAILAQHLPYARRNCVRLAFGPPVVYTNSHTDKLMRPVGREWLLTFCPVLH